MVIVVMGVAGAGKTTVGSLLAARLGFGFVDADHLHPPENIARMRAGLPLGEAARAPWLAALRRAIDGWLAAGQDVVLACSALRRSYRQKLDTDRPDVRLVYLRGPRAVLAERLRARQGHFAGPALLDSQFATLEEPAPGEAVVADITLPPEVLAAQLAAELAPPPA